MNFNLHYIPMNFNDVLLNSLGFVHGIKSDFFVCFISDQVTALTFHVCHPFKMKAKGNRTRIGGRNKVLGDFQNLTR